MQSVCCLLLWWSGPDKSLGALCSHSHTALRALCKPAQLGDLLLFVWFFFFCRPSRSHCIIGRMKKGKKCFENISSLAAEASRGFAEGFGVLISCTFTSCAMHCAVKLQLCSWCHGSRLLCSDLAFACTSSSRFSCSIGKTTPVLGA